jgi:UDP-N-acetylmuramate dehydrogenase
MVSAVHDVTRADLAGHTTLRLGGPAARLAAATHQDELVAMIRQCGDDYLLLAGGSNVVIADAGVQTTVILVRTTGVELRPAADESMLVTVEAGQPWDDLVSLCVNEGLSGIECLSGIPGSAGATPIQNVGAYGQEVAETIASVRVLDRVTDTIVDLSPAQCGFAYRSSLFRGSSAYVVLSVTFRLHRATHSTPIRYAELARALDVDPGESAPLTAVRSAVLGLRTTKGMVLDPVDPDTYSAGSFFTNPVLSESAFAELRERFDPPSWPAPGGVKVSAAWLIERAGFSKGYRGAHDGVAVSGKHTLALTNRGTGTTTALLDLAREIRDGVRKTFDIDLHPEPILINCSL